MNLNNLKKILKPKDNKPFFKLGKHTVTKTGDMIYIDRGSNILGVAHLDYVMWSNPVISGDKVFCPQLDDRLGVFLLLDLLPKMGLDFDVLLTDNEETGNSTAQWFTSKKQYNWIFQFDRRGTDCVMYDYETKKTCKAVEACGFDVGMGSFSDISYLEHLGCKGFNFGVGYYGEHTNGCYANLGETYSQALKFKRFYEKNYDISMPHVGYVPQKRYAPSYNPRTGVSQFPPTAGKAGNSYLSTGNSWDDGVDSWDDGPHYETRYESYEAYQPAKPVKVLPTLDESDVARGFQEETPESVPMNSAAPIASTGVEVAPVKTLPKKTNGVQSIKK